jgi:hypothetical protein
MKTVPMFFKRQSTNDMQENNTKIYYLMYFSASRTKLSQEELKNLLSVCREHNQKAGITGMLMYYDGNFAQVLEGDYEAVKATFKKVANDPRHNQIIKVKEGYEDKRIFGDWSMAFYPLKASDFSNVAGFKMFVYKEIFGDQQIAESHPILTVLKSFYENQPLYRRLFAS